MNSLIKIVFLALLSRAMAYVSVDIEGTTLESFGMVGFGKLASNAVDKYGETMSPGSGLQVDQSTLYIDSNGDYHFTMYGLPDRGWNVKGTVNTFSRIHEFDVIFTPKNSSSSENIKLDYKDTILLKDVNGEYFTGLDSNTTIDYNGLKMPAVKYQGDGWTIPKGNETFSTKISLDAEAITLINGSIKNGFWISDEYGPSLFKFDSNGNMLDYIMAPDALLPHVNGELFFSSDNTLWTDPSYSVTPNEDGRTGNKGYEGMDITPDGKYLFTILQSATVQDGGEKSKSRFNDRLLKYDITVCPPQLVGEYVVVLPTYTAADGKTKTASQSEMRVINENLIMLLPRDSHLGNGGEDGTESIFKHVDFWSLTDADNIVGQYDGVGEKISTKKGVLNSSIKPATYYSFINLIDPTELSKFGLHNGGAVDPSLINEKWESMDLFPVKCTNDEYFLLLGSDNDYKTTDGYLNFGKIKYDQGVDVDTQYMMYHIKLPNLPHGETCDISSSSSSSSSSLIGSSTRIPSSSRAVSSSSLSSSSSSSSLVASPSKAPSSSIVSTSSDSSIDANNRGKSNLSGTSTITEKNTTTATETCEKCTEKPTSYITYTTVTDGVTITVTESCTTESSVLTTKSATSYTTYTTVTDGVTITVTEPCTTESSSVSITKPASSTSSVSITSNSERENNNSKPVSSTTKSSTTVVEYSTSETKSAEPTVSTEYSGSGSSLNVNGVIVPAIAAIGAFIAIN